MSGHLDGPPPGPPDPPYIPGDLGAPSAEEFARRRGQAATFDPRHPHEPEIPPAPDEEAIRCDERERLSARVYENGWCPTCAHKADPDAMPPHEVAAILVDPAEVLSPEEVAEYERCQQSVIDARRRAPMVEGQMIVGAAASPDERLREALRDANEYLAQIADYSPSEVADAIDSVRAQIKDALAATDSRGKPDGASVPDQSCATCGGSGDRNGNRRAADPFGTCPGCGGTGNVAAADREAPDGER